MNLEEFRRLEKMLGHPPTAKEVREHQAKKQMCMFTAPECRLACYATKGRKLLKSSDIKINLN